MKKVLKLRIAKFDAALAAQLLKAEGFNWLNDDSFHISIYNNGGFVLRREGITISLKKYNTFSSLSFEDNAERDKYLKNVIKWISEEQFPTTDGKLEVGKTCYISPFKQRPHDKWLKGKLLAILPARIEGRYIIEDSDHPDGFSGWKCARPINPCIQPKIKNDVYTWEMETK